MKYDVESDSFQQVLDQKYDVVKIDIEGSELDLLTTKNLDWKTTYLLMVEISRNRLVEQNPDGRGWRTYLKILRKLRRKGFKYVEVCHSTFKPSYWKKKGSDFVMLAYRPEADEESEGILQILRQYPRLERRLKAWRTAFGKLLTDDKSRRSV